MIKTENLIKDYVKEVLENPCFGFVTTVNDDGHPIMTRFFGFNIDENITTFTVYTYRKDVEKMIPFLGVNSKIAIAASNPIDFKTIQFKGKFVTLYDTPNSEMLLVDACNKRQVEVFKHWHITEEVFGNWKYKDSVALVMRIEEIFDQTPKANAGEKIN